MAPAPESGRYETLPRSVSDLAGISVRLMQGLELRMVIVNQGGKAKNLEVPPASLEGAEFPTSIISSLLTATA